MARGNIVREWTCDNCKTVARLEVVQHGPANTEPLTPDIESWRLPDGWVRIRIEDRNGTDDADYTDRALELCGDCWNTKTGKVASLTRFLYPEFDVRRRAYAENVPDEVPNEVDLGTQSKYEKIHKATRSAGE